MRFLLLMTFLLSLSASEKGLLLEVKNNSLLYFSVNNKKHVCFPYGVLTFEMLLSKSDANGLCQKSLNQYFKIHPQDKFLARRYFHLQQYYSFKKYEDSCMIYAQGKKRYAQMLLERGLAIVPIDFDDKAVAFQYRRIENQAKKDKKGLWNDPVLQNCMMQLGI
jgi:hypothetical protein